MKDSDVAKAANAWLDHAESLRTALDADELSP